MKTRYSLSREQFHAMRDYSGGHCHLCGELHKKMVVDHCHDTGRVRGLLCQTCNITLGGLERFERLGVDPDSFRASVIDWSHG